MANTIPPFLILPQGYIFWPFPPQRGGGILSKSKKNREEFEGGLEKRKGKGGKEEKEERVTKHTLKYQYEA